MFNAIVIVFIAVVVALAAFIACMMSDEAYDETLVNWNGQKN